MLTTIYTVQCTQKHHPKPTEGIGATVMWQEQSQHDDDACDTNSPPTNSKFQHSSMMISLSTGDLAANKVPCAYRQNTSKPKHQRSLCNTCDDSCVYTTQQAILLTHLWYFWHVGLAMGLKSPTEHYMASRAVHQTQQSSNRIDRNCLVSDLDRTCD